MHLEEGNDVCKNNNVVLLLWCHLHTATTTEYLSCYTEIFSVHDKKDEGS